jgi:hypothetical protein
MSLRIPTTLLRTLDADTPSGMVWTVLIMLLLAAAAFFSF